MNQLLNHMFLAANRSQMNVGYSHLGIITSVDAANYAVKVLLQPEEIETGWIPYPTLFNGFVAPPSGGEQVLITFERGNNNVPIASSIIYWNEGRAPGINADGDTAAGEILLKHNGSGSYVKWTNDGKLLINGNTEIDITTPQLSVTTTGDVKVIAGGNVDITANSGQVTIESPTINLKGNVVIDGTLTANNGSITMIAGAFSTNANITTTQDVKASGISLNSHVHGGVSAGGSNTAGPV